jgi:hypothetical protein
MVRHISRCPVAALLIFVALLVSGCAQKSPEEKVADLRSYYTAELNSFMVEEEPVSPEVPELPGDEESASVAEEPAAEDEGDTIEPAPTVEASQKIQLDILIKHRSEERLPGITVDIGMVDANEVEKGHWRVWFDTSQIMKANVTPFTHILEDVGYEEGDMFFAEIRHPVPVEDRGEYREFAATP